MTNKQTCCPKCHTIYKVTVTQLTVSGGMVCCAKCQHNFNALLHLVKTDIKESKENTFEQVENVSPFATERTVLDIFNRKTENSHINLRTYLNNLNQFNTEPLQNIPSLHLSLPTNHIPKRTLRYYSIWFLINLILFLVLFFQVLWFNPNLTDQHPLLNRIFNQTCAAFKCDTAKQRYSQMSIEHIKVTRSGQQKTDFSGTLTNHYKKSLELPRIKVTLKAHGKITASYLFEPAQYLDVGLSGITRIPTARPYRFNFTIPHAKNTFDHYHLEMIHP